MPDGLSSVTMTPVTNITTNELPGEKSEPTEVKRTDLNRNPPPTENKELESKSAPQKVNFIGNNNLKELSQKLKELRLNRPNIRILHEQRPDTRNAFQKLWYGLFETFRSYKERDLSEFQLNTNDRVVEGLLGGKLNHYQTERVMDRLRYFAVSGDEEQKVQARDILTSVVKIYWSGLGGILSNNTAECAQKLKYYYQGVAKDINAVLQRHPNGVQEILKQITIADRYLLLCTGKILSDGASDLMRKHVNPDILNKKYYDDSFSGAINGEMSKDNMLYKKRCDELRGNIEDAVTNTVEKYLSFEAKDILDLVRDFEKDSGGKRGIVRNYLNEINPGVYKLFHDKYYRNDDFYEKVFKAFETLKKNKSTAPLVREYCEEFLRACLLGTEKYALPDYADTISLKGLIALPILATALQGPESKVVADELLQLLDSRGDREGMGHVRSAMKLAEEWSRQEN